MNIHSVFPVDENRVATKISSCFYDGCFVAGKFRKSCPGWEEPIVRFPDEIEIRQWTIRNLERTMSEME
jgi:hypothetical protein